MSSPLVFNPSSCDFGSANVWGPWPEVTIEIENVGFAPVHIYTLIVQGMDATSFFISSNLFNTDIIQEEILTFRVQFMPVSAFGKSAQIVVVSDILGPSPTMDVSGFGIGPVMLLDPPPPAPLAFGGVLVDTSDTQSFRITNIGNDVLDLLDITILPEGDASQFLSLTNFASLDPGETLFIRIIFTPTSVGDKTASLRILSNDPQALEVLVTLTGTGETSPVIQIVPLSRDFGEIPVNSNSGVQIFTVSNVNTQILSIDAIFMSGLNPGEFDILNDNVSGAELEHGQSATFQVRFSPTGTGNKTADIYIPSNIPTSPTIVRVSGKGIAGRLSVTPQEKNFGNMPVGSISATQTFTVQNTGDAGVILGNITMEGTDAISFIKSSDDASGRTITPGTSASFAVYFAPSAPGLKTAKIRIPSNEPGTSVKFVTLFGTGVSPAISVTPMEGSFGSVVVGMTSSPLEITVRNTGTADLVVGSIVIGGASAAEFVKQNDNVTGHIIAPGLAATFQIVFKPLSAGTKVGSVTIKSNAADTQTVTLPLAGTGQTNPVIAASPTFKSFGDVPAGSASASQLLTVTNTNTLPLVIGTLFKDGVNPSEFLIRNDNTSGRTLLHGESTTFEVVFSPLIPGEKQAAIHVPTNDPVTPDLSIPLSGRGTAALIVVQPAAWDFGEVRYGSTSLPQTFLVQNIGTADLIVGMVSITGANASDFQKFNDLVSGTTLGPEQFSTFDVLFRPGSGGVKTAQACIPSNAHGIPAVFVLLSGSGLAEPLTAEPPSKAFTPALPRSGPVTQTFAVTNRALYPVTMGNAFILYSSAQNTQASESAVPAAAFLPAALRAAQPQASAKTATLAAVPPRLTASYDSPFTLANDQVSGRTLQSGESATLQIVFIPARPGTYRGFVIIPTNDPLFPNLSIPLAAFVPVGVRISVQPFMHSFGGISAGNASAPMVFTVSSVNSGNLSVADIIITGRDSASFRKVKDQVSGKLLPSGESATFEVCFTPVSPGCKEASVQIFSNDPQAPVFTLWLYGRGDRKVHMLW